MARDDVKKLVLLGLFVAILLLFSFTPLGYFKLGFVEITFNMLPIIIGSILFGERFGAILGIIFGATSLIQCFGQSSFGVMIFGINPILTTILCFVPRIIAGWLPGSVYGIVRRRFKKRWPAYVFAALAGSLTNTFLFTFGFALLFHGKLVELASANGQSPFIYLCVFFLLNGLLEAVVNTVITIPICNAFKKTGHY